MTRGTFCSKSCSNLARIGTKNLVKRRARAIAGPSAARLSGLDAI